MMIVSKQLPVIGIIWIWGGLAVKSVPVLGETAG